jgi:2-methylcitrate dehydratase PrpD
MVAGVFSSAAVTARLLGLDPTTTTHALGIAGSQAGGLLAFLATSSSTKQLHPGFASQAGVIAARLAAAGATGPETVFDGPHGVYDALARGQVDTSVIVTGLGERWETTRIGIKPWPTCQLAHATMAAARAAMSEADVGAARVVSLKAQVHPDSAPTVCALDRDLTRPTSDYAAKFSLPWSVAAMLIDGAVEIGTYSSANLSRADLTDLASRITWEVSVASSQAAADAPGDVLVTLDDGRTVAGHVDRSPGGGGAPLAEAEFRSKLAGNVGPLADRLADAVATLPTAPDLTDLIRVTADAAVADRRTTTDDPEALP